MKRTRAQRAITGVKVENARWMGNLLARLSDKQLGDAFRAGHYSEEEIQLYVRSMRARIKQLQNLRGSGLVQVIREGNTTAGTDFRGFSPLGIAVPAVLGTPKKLHH
jgi:hypothetical protein